MGTLRASELTQAIETAFADEWLRLRGTALPAAGGEERRMLFVAVANGVLGYLAANERDFISSITFDRNEGESWGVDSLDLNIS